jgi:hypothetical protein
VGRERTGADRERVGVTGARVVSDLASELTRTVDGGRTRGCRAGEDDGTGGSGIRLSSSNSAAN